MYLLGTWICENKWEMWTLCNLRLKGTCVILAGVTFQALIFHVEKHPVATWFEQCVTFNSFPSEATELAYSIFGFVFLYGFPLVMIIGCYGCILCEICKINNLSHTGKSSHFCIFISNQWLCRCVLESKITKYWKEPRVLRENQRDWKESSKRNKSHVIARQSINRVCK